VSARQTALLRAIVGSDQTLSAWINDHLRDVARLLGRALWPENAWLLARYGRQDIWQRWQHIWSVARARV
jgi:cystathionine beta-lyase/cystathionine gamma-synthase